MFGNALDSYSHEMPSLQNAVDIFKDEWSSIIPGATSSGFAPLFQDQRVTTWIHKVREYFAGSEKLNNLNVLELGPLEGAHSFMLASQGWNVTSVESNSRAFLKTLIIYNHFQLKAKALYGDFIPYLQNPETPVYDFMAASGVLYHMKNPLEAIDLMAQKCLTIGIWTHFVTDEFMQTMPTGWPPTELETSGFTYTGYKQFYGAALNNNAFCGGGQDYSIWLRPEDICSRLASHGFVVDINATDLNHPSGPCFAIFAARAQS